MKIIYVNEIGRQVGLSVPYNFDKNIRIGDIILKDNLWEESEDMVITNIEIENHIIFCTLRTYKKY